MPLGVVAGGDKTMWMFRDEGQQARTMQTLLKRAGVVFADDLFADGKPSDSFFACFEHIGAYSHGEQILLKIALDLWNGDGVTRLFELFCLDGRNQSLVLSLLQALSAGPQAVERWIAEGSMGLSS
jgi:hypothetical protein